MKLKSAVQVSRRIADIGQAGWDACAANPDYRANPFVSFDFLDIAEAAGCAVERAGWGPQHITVEDEAGAVAAAMPLYLKSHSQGEYVFDHAWADAYERAGGSYYPKLISAAPFTPATGPRMLVRSDVDREEAWRILLGGALAVCERYEVSSLHVNFPTQDEWTWMGGQGLALRQGQLYHWLNQGYSSFDDFLGALSSGRRKTIRRERRDAQSEVEIFALTGAEITEDHWDAFFAFYMDTGSRKWGRPYLTRDFFTRVGTTMADRIALVMAFRDQTPIAGALNFIGRDALYGRQWGTLDDVPFLQFELCYYQAIDFAIARGLSRVEAGAQGEHKIARGYLPSPVYSAHFIADPALREPVARYLEGEGPAVEEQRAAMTAELSPFKHG